VRSVWQPVNPIAKQDGTDWRALGVGPSAPCNAIGPHSDDVFTGGISFQAGGGNSSGITRYGEEEEGVDTEYLADRYPDFRGCR
jgi:hypothetical protein